MVDLVVAEKFAELQAATQQAHLVSRRGWVDDEWMAAWADVFRLQRELADLLLGTPAGAPTLLRTSSTGAVPR